MAPASTRTVRFVRALVAGATATLEGDHFVALLPDGRKTTLDRGAVDALRSTGAIGGSAAHASANAGSRTWLRRALSGGDALADQHRVLARRPDGAIENRAESPLGRLSTPGSDGAPPFLEPHQLEAGNRIMRLAQRARLQPRVTMSYDMAHTASGARNAAIDVSDFALDARRDLSDALATLPRECAGVVLDVCGLLKGLQTVEIERGWPRRSAKLVLRIGLEQLARHFGLAPVATGKSTAANRHWLGEGARPTILD